MSEAGRAGVGLIQMWPNASFPGDSVFSPKLKIPTDSLPPIQLTQEI